MMRQNAGSEEMPLEERVRSTGTRLPGRSFLNSANAVLHDTTAFAASSALLAESYVLGAAVASKVAAKDLESIAGTAVNGRALELWTLAGIGALTAGTLLYQPLKRFGSKMRTNLRQHRLGEKEYNWPLVIGTAIGAVALPLAASYLSPAMVSTESVQDVLYAVRESVNKETMFYAGAALAAGAAARHGIAACFNHIKNSVKSIQAKLYSAAIIPTLFALTVFTPFTDYLKSTKPYQFIAGAPSYAAVLTSTADPAKALQEWKDYRNRGIEAGVLEDVTPEGTFFRIILDKTGDKKSVSAVLDTFKRQLVVKRDSWIKELDETDSRLSLALLEEHARSRDLPPRAQYIHAMVPFIQEISVNTEEGKAAQLTESEALDWSMAIYKAAETFKVPIYEFSAIPYQETNYASSVVGDLKHKDGNGNTNDARTSFQFLRRTMESWYAQFISDKDAMEACKNAGVAMWGSLPSYQEWHNYPTQVAMIAAYKFRKDIEFWLPRYRGDIEQATYKAIGSWNGGRGNPQDGYANKVIAKSNSLREHIAGIATTSFNDN